MRPVWVTCTSPRVWIGRVQSSLMTMLRSGISALQSQGQAEVVARSVTL